MDRNRSEDGVIYFGELEFQALIARLIRSYRFHNNNEMPKKIVLPAVDEVDGIPIERASRIIEVPTEEVKDAVTS